VDGVVTEDSDIFLFGGKCVYKNIFEEKKFVEVHISNFSFNSFHFHRFTLRRISEEILG
jgi:DNA excision repair protein ERCC-5